MKYRRVNMIGAPSSGKSTSATGIFSDLKKKGYNIEYIPEYVKKWTYHNREVRSLNQWYLFHKQAYLEDEALNAGFDLVISDCPLYMSVWYAKYSKTPGWELIEQQADLFEEMYPSLNIFIRRGEKKYDTVGRFHTEEQSKEIEVKLKSYISEKVERENVFSLNQYDIMLEFILNELKG